MKQHIKQWIKKGLTERCRRQYDKLLEQKTVAYDAWVKEAEQVWHTKEAQEQIRYIPYDACREYVTGNAMQSDTAEIVLFADADGEVSEIAGQVVSVFFGCHEEVDLAYGDEDVMSPEGIRYTPWLKPDWSPDTFLSFFYFGSIFAVRMRALRALTQEEKRWIWESGESNGIYRLCFMLAAKIGGFERRVSRDIDGAIENESFCRSAFPVGHMDAILFHSRVNRELEVEHSAAPDWSGCLAEDESGGLKVSVIIPSKDNPEVLKRCICSLQRAVDEYEVIVVDNGSAKPVKQELENWLREQGSSYHYIYQPMPFHFSQMCNLGAEAASGNVLLFLNDDVELPEQIVSSAACLKTGDSFLHELYQAAIRPFTGAVGVKLYYPNSRRIQHAGIVNLRLGPVHKLQYKGDEHSYYYGWNRRRRNVIAVTGACLAVEKKKFEEIGGFPEELPVAFNDVDVCFSLHEKGYYNVVLQDVPLFHHESLSRGNDDSREKLNRLLGEKDKLYERHPGLCGTDPFYHKYFANDMLSTGFELRSDYDGKPQSACGKVREQKGLLADAREDACVMISLEYAGLLESCRQNRPDEAGTKADSDRKYRLQGYSFITGSDNACFEKYLIFRPDTNTDDGGETIRYVKAEPFVRKDVEINLPDQVHVGMTGFNMELAAGDLPKENCRVGVMVRDKCSGQKIYAWTNRYLDAE